MSLIRVFVLPSPGDGFAADYLFGRAQRVAFLQVDWFRDDHQPCDQEHEADYRTWIEKKTYAVSARELGFPLLVLGPKHSFTIGYEAP
jgi:hypothetical protein